MKIDENTKKETDKFFQKQQKKFIGGGGVDLGDIFSKVFEIAGVSRTTTSEKMKKKYGTDLDQKIKAGKFSEKTLNDFSDFFQLSKKSRKILFDINEEQKKYSSSKLEIQMTSEAMSLIEKLMNNKIYDHNGKTISLTSIAKESGISKGGIWVISNKKRTSEHILFKLYHGLNKLADEHGEMVEFRGDNDETEKLNLRDFADQLIILAKGQSTFDVLKSDGVDLPLTQQDISDMEEPGKKPPRDSVYISQLKAASSELRKGASARIADIIARQNSRKNPGIEI